jgi:ubiquitin-conjugating enzyme E2 D
MNKNFARNPRLQKELKLINEKESDNVSAGPVNDDITHWRGIIIGPTDTPYANEIMELNIVFPIDYPYKPPHIKFVNPIWHPNVNPDTGDICLDILKDNWSPALNITKVLMSISSLLEDPNPEDPYNCEAANEYKKHTKLFNSNVKKYFAKYQK